MIRNVLIVLLCFIAVNVSARQVITGNLSDQETSKPVDGASVELLQLPDSAVVEMTRTNTEGLFVFYKGDTIKNYCLRTKRMGYKTQTFPVVQKKKGMINNLGTLLLSPSMYMFKEVVVNGSKVKVTELGDRTIYGIPDGIKKTSTDGLDVLRKVPSVQVDYLNENITVNGKSNIKIEVDGVTRDKEYLKKLHPSQVDKMEVITSPSGKYDADVDAVINIVTNPAMRYGLKGMVNLMALPASSDAYMGRANGNLDYGKEKISYYIAANGMLQNFNFITDMNRNSGTGSLVRNGNQGSKYGSGNVNVGMIYDPNELNNLNLNLSYNNNSNKGNSDSRSQNDLAGSTNSIYRTISNSKTNSDGLNASMFYKHKFDKKTQHGYEVELNYSTNLNNTSTNDFQNITYNPVKPSDILYSGTLQHEYTNTKRQTVSGQSNYTLPFDSVYSLNVGVSGNFNKYNIDNTNTTNTAQDLKYTDFRSGGYAELSRTFKKGSIKIGSRFENSHVVINSSSTSNFFSPLPYANGYYKINGDNSVKLSYSRRVIRPGVSQLNPFVSVVDSQTISKGNPDLKPAYRDNFQFTYNWKLTVKKVTLNLSPQLFYEYKTGLIQTILTRDASGIYTNQPQNISDGYEAGAGLSVNSQIAMVMFNSNFRYSLNHVNSYLDQIEAKNQKSWNWNSYVMCPLPKNFKFFSVFNISGPTLSGQTETKMAPFYLVGLVKQFKNNSTLTLLSFNPFSSKFFDSKSTLRSSTVYQFTESYMSVKRAFMLVYSYNFKVGKSIEKQKRTQEQSGEDNGFKLPF